MSKMFPDPRDRPDDDVISLDWLTQWVGGALGTAGSKSAENAGKVRFWKLVSKAFTVITVLSIVSALASAISDKTPG